MFSKTHLLYSLFKKSLSLFLSSYLHTLKNILDPLNERSHYSDAVCQTPNAVLHTKAPTTASKPAIFVLVFMYFIQNCFICRPLESTGGRRMLGSNPEAEFINVRCTVSLRFSGHNLESSQTRGFCMDFLKQREGGMFLSGFPIL
jgi:hypothetical protein